MLLRIVIIHRFSFLYNIFSVNIVHYFQLSRHLGSFQFGTIMNSGAKTMSSGEYVCNQIGVYSYLCLMMLPKMLIEILDLCVSVCAMHNCHYTLSVPTIQGGPLEESH